MKEALNLHYLSEISYQLSLSMAEKAAQSVNDSRAASRESLQPISAATSLKQDNQSQNKMNSLQPVVNMNELQRFSFKNSKNDNVRLSPF
jgi:hypothetical protein